MIMLSPPRRGRNCTNLRLYDIFHFPSSFAPFECQKGAKLKTLYLNGLRTRNGLIHQHILERQLHLEELGQVKEDGKDDHGQLEELDVGLGHEVGGAELANETNADVTLKGDEDGAIDRGHENDVNHWDEDHSVN